MAKKYIPDDYIISDWIVELLNNMFTSIETMYPVHKYYELYLYNIDEDNKTIDYIFILN